jgi:hypothetical protein
MVEPRRVSTLSQFVHVTPQCDASPVSSSDLRPLWPGDQDALSTSHPRSEGKHTGIAPESRDGKMRELWGELARPVTLFDEPSPMNFLTGRNRRIL